MEEGEGESIPELKLEIQALQDQLHDSHLQRLKSGKCSIVGGLLYGDMIACFTKIAKLSYGIAAQKRGIAHG